MKLTIDVEYIKNPETYLDEKINEFTLHYFDLVKDIQSQYDEGLGKVKVLGVRSGMNNLPSVSNK